MKEVASKTNWGLTKQIKGISNMRVSYSTVNRNNPSTIYIEFEGWATPRRRYISNFDYIRKKLDKRMRKALYFNIDRNIFNENKTLVTMAWNEKGWQYNKNSYVQFEITIKQRTNYEFLDDKIREAVTDIVKSINGVIDNHDDLIFKDRKNR